MASPRWRVAAAEHRTVVCSSLTNHRRMSLALVAVTAVCVFVVFAANTLHATAPTSEEHDPHLLNLLSEGILHEKKDRHPRRFFSPRSDNDRHMESDEHCAIDSGDEGVGALTSTDALATPDALLLCAANPHNARVLARLLTDDGRAKSDGTNAVSCLLRKESEAHMGSVNKIKSNGQSTAGGASAVVSNRSLPRAWREGRGSNGRMRLTNPIDEDFYFNPITGVLREEGSGANKETIPFRLPPSLLFGDAYLDDPRAPWNQPECFAESTRLSTTYDPNADEEDEYMYASKRGGYGSSSSSAASFDFFPWYRDGLDWLTTRGPPPEVGLRCAAPMSILHELSTTFGDVGGPDSVTDPTKAGPCLLSLAIGQGGCNPYRESVASCVIRQGYDRLRSVVSLRCQQGPFWQREVPKAALAASKFVRSLQHDDDNSGGDGTTSSVSDHRRLSEGKTSPPPPTPGVAPPRNIADERIARLTPRNPKNRPPPSLVALSHTNAVTVCPVGDEGRADMHPYVPPSERTIAPLGPPRACSADRTGSLRHFPLAFGLPKRNFYPKFAPKVFDFHPIAIDSNFDGPHALLHYDEEVYDALGALSYFSPTAGRAGWEALRHHQHLTVASGFIARSTSAIAVLRRRAGAS